MQETEQEARQRLEVPNNFKLKELKDTGTMTKTHTAPAPANAFDAFVNRAIELGNIELLKEVIAERNKELARIAKLEFKEAKAEFLKNCPPIIRNADVDYKLKDDKGKVQFNFADLDEIIEKVKKPLGEAGLSFSWRNEEMAANGDIVVTAVLSHIGGHEETNTQSAPPDGSGGKAPIHARQSTRTYLKRQTLSDVLGISPGNRDDDGKAGAGYNDDQRTTIILAKPSNTQFNNALKGLRDGTTTWEVVETAFQWSEEQIDQLKKAVQS